MHEHARRSAILCRLSAIQAAWRGESFDLGLWDGWREQHFTLKQVEEEWRNAISLYDEVFPSVDSV